MDELKRLDGSKANVTFIATMTEPENSHQPWDGETGFFDQDKITKYVGDLRTLIYYLCGPAGLVKAMRSLLTGAGVDDDDIRTEEFTGY
ncbi:Na(+)-translocating NADH-quinone reductase subunit F [Arthrobacter sp. SO3]|nr:Na(+)-translocating NADH-quinone reductase subunit F [Arthrobacter sp. SO3]